MTQASEGQIKYRLEHIARDPAPELHALLPYINGWRSIMMRLGMIGQNADRYDGLGFGNISLRSPGGYWVTATATGSLALLDAPHIPEVTHADPQTNTIYSRGEFPPSSEALTHGALYSAIPEAGAIVHGHCSDIWQRRHRLKYFSTAEHVEYGGPAMAMAVIDGANKLDRPISGTLIMGGHQDGILCWGRDLAQASLLIIQVLAEALSLTNHH